MSRRSASSPSEIDSGFSTLSWGRSTRPGADSDASGARRENIPGILLNSLPNTGSCYNWEAIRHTLGIPTIMIGSWAWFPNDVAIPSQVKLLANGGAIAKHHSPATFEFAAPVSYYLDKMWVHVRDPRSVALEWRYSLVTLKTINNPEQMAFLNPLYCPKGFFELSKTEQIEVMVQNMLPECIEWVLGWLDAEADPDFKTEILFTQYEKLGFVKSKANGYATASLIVPVVDPLWDVRTDETEIPWLIAERLAKRGFTNLLDYFTNEFKDPETGGAPANGAEFTERSLKIMTAPLWDGKDAKVGGDKVNGWQDFVKRGMWNSDRYKPQKRWGAFKTKTKKFELYSETLKAALEAHAEKHGSSVDEILKLCKYEAQGELGFVPHYESPYRWGSREKYPFDFIDYKSRLNREGRSQNCTWYQEFKKVDVGDESWGDVLKINPADAARLGIKDGDDVRVTSPVASIEVKARLWEGVRPGTVAKCFGQGHWAYGRTAAGDYDTHKPRGGNNNELIPADVDRLSGSTARNGGVAGVRIEKA